ncbi:MAG: hypothetical protein HBSIN01_31370 [Candidatus Brocadia sinica]|nr:MAG: hypothetical protein BroJett002_14480 [Candidatus Brocadia sinica]GJQ19178.1 MAG: hypothetical protein HBSIN01_31370 [Candidatus Brocadia sinica]
MHTDIKFLVLFVSEVKGKEGQCYKEGKEHIGEGRPAIPEISMRSSKDNSCDEGSALIIEFLGKVINHKDT